MAIFVHQEVISVYGKGNHVEYPGNRTLWYFGELQGELIERVKDKMDDEKYPTGAQVGPFSGWDRNIALSYAEAIPLDTCCQKVIRCALSTRGRPPVVKENKTRVKLGPNKRKSSSCI